MHMYYHKDYDMALPLFHLHSNLAQATAVGNAKLSCAFREAKVSNKSSGHRQLEKE